MDSCLDTLSPTNTKKEAKDAPKKNNKLDKTIQSSHPSFYKHSKKEKSSLKRTLF